MEETTTKQWVYDFNSFTLPTDEVDLDDITANPEKYLDYDPNKTESNEDKIAALEKENAELKENFSMLSDCIMEMSEQVYS